MLCDIIVFLALCSQLYSNIHRNISKITVLGNILVTFRYNPLKFGLHLILTMSYVVWHLGVQELQ
jgi:hypothetical protein